VTAEEPSSEQAKGAGLIGLPEAAERLGVHYMTAYRHIRTGRLPAVRHNGQWLIDPADLDPKPPRRRRSPDGSPTPARLAQRLVAGDEAGSWALIEDAMAGGAEAPTVHVELLTPALQLIGDEWAAGRWSVADEHRATTVVLRLLGRLGPQFTRPGRTRGTVIVGAAPGDQHALPGGMLADLVRSAGFAAVDLGANTPAESFARAVESADRPVALLIGMTTPGLDDDLTHAVAVARATGVPVLVGGAAIEGADHARAVGADGWTGPTAADAVAAVEALAAARRR
jgi:excisionase family DNA binding protein